MKETGRAYTEDSMKDRMISAAIVLAVSVVIAGIAAVSFVV